MKKFSDQGRNHDRDLQGNMGRELCQIICLQDGIAILMEISNGHGKESKYVC